MLTYGTPRLGDSKGLAQQPGCVSGKKQNKTRCFGKCFVGSQVRRAFLQAQALAKQPPRPSGRLDAGVCSHRALKETRGVLGEWVPDAVGRRGGWRPRKAGPEGFLQETQRPRTAEKLDAHREDRMGVRAEGSAGPAAAHS